MEDETWQSLRRRVRLVVTALAESGLIKIQAKPVNGSGFADGTARTLRVVIQQEDAETVGVTIRNEESGTSAYLQGRAPILSLARELGFEVAR